MKNMIKISLILGLFVTSLPAYSRCPVFDKKDLAEIVCPIYGLIPLHTIHNITYTRKLNVLGVASNFCSFLSKVGRTEGYYDGTESDFEYGKLMCHYNVSGRWKNQIPMEKFSMSTVVDNTDMIPSLHCPLLTFNEMKAILCGKSVPREVTPFKWSVYNKSNYNTICSMENGPSGQIKGRISDETIPFEHTCTYTYHPQGNPVILELRGKMNLTLLRKGNAETKEFDKEYKQYFGD